MTDIITYLTEHALEGIGVLLSLAYICCSIKGWAALWILGIISAAIYIVVYYNSRFYADMAIQFYYIGVSIVGLWRWLRPGHDKKETQHDTQHIGVTEATARERVLLLLTCLATWLILWLILRQTDSPVPIADALTTALCIIGTWMLVKKEVENWLVFILADGISAGLYIWKGLLLTSGLFALYTLLAVIGYIRWNKELKAATTLLRQEKQ